MNGERPRSSSTSYNCDALRVSGYVCPKSPTVHAVAPGLWSIENISEFGFVLQKLTGYRIIFQHNTLIYTRFLLIPAARRKAGNEMPRAAARRKRCTHLAYCPATSWHRPSWLQRKSADHTSPAGPSCRVNTRDLRGRRFQLGPRIEAAARFVPLGKASMHALERVNNLYPFMFPADAKFC
jgi:hypothetical protein